MLKCPFCNNVLTNHNADGWQCECGETIAFGFEIEAAEACEVCPVATNCPKKKSPIGR